MRRTKVRKGAGGKGIRCCSHGAPRRRVYAVNQVIGQGSSLARALPKSATTIERSIISKSVFNPC